MVRDKHILDSATKKFREPEMDVPHVLVVICEALPNLLQNTVLRIPVSEFPNHIDPMQKHPIYDATFAKFLAEKLFEGPESGMGGALFSDPFQMHLLTATPTEMTKNVWIVNLNRPLNCIAINDQNK